MKLLPTGISDYKELIEQNYYYIDKTLLIKDILSYGKVILTPRPRRFGKTLNLSMLKYFFERSEQSNEHLFQQTAIWEHPEYKTLQGQFPVIFLTFKGIKGASWQVCYEKFALTISEEFDRHRYLLAQGALQSEEKNLYQLILDRKASEAELAYSLYFLAKLLSRHYAKKAIVLIDEYDVPIQTAYVHGYYGEAIEFLISLLTAILKDNNFLEKGVLTGVLTIPTAGIFTDLNNLDVFNLTSIPFADKFGFTIEEVKTLLDYYGLQDFQKEIERWYDGYTFGSVNGIFNPWSVLKCVQNNGSLEMYWANTSDNILVKRLIAQASISIKAELELLLNNNAVEQPIVESITFPDLDLRSELVWSLLLFTGYLTYENYELKAGKKVCSLSIPNQEIRHLYLKMLDDILQEPVMGGQVQNLLSHRTQS